VSVHRRSTMQIRVKRVESRTGPEIVSRLHALDGSVEQMERDILLREIESTLTPEGGADFSSEGPRFLERGDREVSRQLGELRRQSDEPLEAEISRAGGRKGVENTDRA
jgi:hypothetical protein